MFIKLNTNKETAGTLKALGMLLHTVSDETGLKIVPEVNILPEAMEREDNNVEDVSVERIPPVYPSHEFDSAGVRWDETLHSSTRAKNKDGTWRERRTVKKDEESVLPDQTSVLPNTQSILPNSKSMLPEATLFSKVLENVTKLHSTGKLTKAQITQILNNFDIPSVAVLQNYPQHFATLNAKFEEVLGG